MIFSLLIIYIIQKLYVDTYDPHYRIVKKEYIDYMKGIEFVYKQIQNNERTLICVEGPCASGKQRFQTFFMNCFH